MWRDSWLQNSLGSRAFRSHFACLPIVLKSLNKSSTDLVDGEKILEECVFEISKPQVSSGIISRDTNQKWSNNNCGKLKYHETSVKSILQDVSGMYLPKSLLTNIFLAEISQEPLNGYYWHMQNAAKPHHAPPQQFGMSRHSSISGTENVLYAQNDAL